MNAPPRCNTSDINEELGLVTHLFSDKTGTLTQAGYFYNVHTQKGDSKSMEQTIILISCVSVTDKLLRTSFKYRPADRT